MNEGDAMMAKKSELTLWYVVTDTSTCEVYPESLSETGAKTMAQCYRDWGMSPNAEARCIRVDAKSLQFAGTPDAWRGSGVSMN